MKIRVLRVEFDEVLMPYEISEFRGAFIEKVGRNNIIFNNHLDDTKYKYGYPLVQYKSIGNRPTLLCIEDGVDEVHHFFNQKNWDLKINDRILKLSLYNLNLKQFNIQVWENLFEYRLKKWLPFNQDNLNQNLPPSYLPAVFEKTCNVVVEHLQRLSETGRKWAA